MLFPTAESAKEKTTTTAMTVPTPGRDAGEDGVEWQQQLQSIENGAPDRQKSVALRTVVVCIRCQQVGRDEGTSWQDLEARCAAEATARMAAEERAERAERAVIELKAVLKTGGAGDRVETNEEPPVVVGAAVVVATTTTTTAQNNAKKLEDDLDEARAVGGTFGEMLREKRESHGEPTVSFQNRDFRDFVFFDVISCL